MRAIQYFVIIGLLIAAAGVHIPPPAHAADKAAEKRQELKRVKREMQQKKRKIKEANRKERSILSELDRLDRAIQSGAAELADQRNRLQTAEATLRELERNAAGLRQELDVLKDLYRRRVRVLYKRGAYRHAASLFAFEGFHAALRNARYLSAVAERDQELISKYGATLDQMTRRQEEIADRKDDIVRRKRAAEMKKAELEQSRKSKGEVLTSVRKQKILYEQTLEELEETSANLWAMIKKAEEERRARRRAARPTPRETAAVQEAKGRLPWPVNGEIITRFGVQKHPRFGTRVFRRGIEIKAPDGSSVRAVQDGQIAYADWYRGFGKLMIVDHGSGIYTLYGHLGRIDARKGDRVQKGQAIGLVGDTGTQDGPLLYFELRRNGEAEDPLRWLSRR